ncbi:MAG: ATP synthase F1 subunit delta [Candidatus Aminicenantes bacterium]|jgi:F-type H+-transporting ATPase subunit delta
MKDKTLVRRYTQGLINSISDKKEFDELLRQLRDFLRFLSRQEELNHILTESILPAVRKQAIGKEILAELDMSPKMKRFIQLLINNDRLELLSEILEFLPDMWNAEQGISSFEVSSVVPLSDSQKRELQGKLERMEKKPVSLKYKIDSSLIGGVLIWQGNIVYDASLRGALAKMREHISEG